ncbi:DUF6087 family protein [Streptomyces hesseae]|uniref:DUF6087 family protein n=1 Tax=Streptomyces hesseae TaxID=3075519 RepID=A0ABU2SY84_9ACTN|nr:DUF6087 family protein [Streptomyces sp. DSM 40473]MDT0453817.1 DUF6087 family protein [Streptomyces sp. DSM 40473]
MHGGAGHLHPDQPRALEQWDSFTYVPAGTAPDLAAAQQWANEQTTGESTSQP